MKSSINFIILEDGMGRPKKVYSIDNLTKKQEEIYEYIKDCVQKKNYPPSVRP